MSILQAFHNKEEIKDKYLKRVQAHYDADEIIHGIYWEKGKGCAVGCTIEGDDHTKYETELGIPASIAHLEDTIFEGLENGASKEFPLRFLKAIKPGADLSLVIPKFIVWLFREDGDVYTNAFNDGKKAIVQVRDLYQRIIEGGQVTDKEWDNANSAAWSATESAWSAESARSAASSAESAARSAWSAAWSAIAPAARSAASSAESAWSAESAAYEAMSKKLLELLEAAE